jgi:hypothetical protein
MGTAHTSKLPAHCRPQPCPLLPLQADQGGDGQPGQRKQRRKSLSTANWEAAELAGLVTGNKKSAAGAGQ